MGDKLPLLLARNSALIYNFTRRHLISCAYQNLYTFSPTAIETTKDGRILLEGDRWEYQGCKFQFTREKTIATLGCPQMKTVQCYLYNGAVCCAKKCPGNITEYLNCLGE